MKYYQDNVLSKWSAKFSDAKLEESFNSEYIQKNLKIVYLICAELIISTSVHMITHSLYDLVRISKIASSVFVLVLLNILPIKYAQFILIPGLIFSTCITLQEIKLEYNNSYEIPYLSGITQVIIWMVDVYNFKGEAFALIINMFIITYYSTLSYSFRSYYWMWILIIIAFKYFKNMNDRRLFLSLKNFQQWENISEKIIPNLFILQSFDYRTHKMSVYDYMKELIILTKEQFQFYQQDCNQKAKEFDIHKSSDKYIEFLNQFQIENVNMNSSNLYCIKRNQELKTLKDYLLEKHALIYTDFVQNKSNLFGKLKEMKMKLSQRQSQIYQKQSGKESLCQNNIETLSISSNQLGQSKKTFFKVSIYNFMINEPCLVICIEDSSLVQKVQNLETNFYKREDKVSELVRCIKENLNSVIQLSKSSTQHLQRQIIQTQIILQAFQQKVRPIQISSFMFSEVLEKIKSTYSDYNLQIEAIQSNYHIQSDKGFIFITIIYFISALGVENISQLMMNYIKDKFCEKITLNIQSRYLNQDLQNLSQTSVFGLKSFSNLNSECWQYLKNIMKQICLQDKPQIKLINDDSVILQIEFITDVTVLEEDKKGQQKSYINQICNEQINLSYSNTTQLIKTPFNQNSSKYSQNKFFTNIGLLNSKKMITSSPMLKHDSIETQTLSYNQGVQIL